MTVSIGKESSAGEETRAAASISVVNLSPLLPRHANIRHHTSMNPPLKQPLKQCTEESQPTAKKGAKQCRGAEAALRGQRVQ